MPSPNPRIPLIALLFAVASTSLAQAQTTWPQPGTHADYGTVEVITLANPSIRHYCRVHAITADTIACGIGMARKPVVYQRTDIAALLKAAKPRLGHSLITAGIIVLTVDGFIATAVLSPWVTLAIAGAAASFAFYLAISPQASFVEQILYERSNTPLTITLRTH